MQPNIHQAYQNAFAKAQTQTEIPWLKEVRRQGLDRFLKKGFPQTKEEDWKYTRLNHLQEIPFELSAAIHPIEDLKPWTFLFEKSYQIIFFNGHLIQIPKTLPKGLYLSSLNSASSLSQDTWSEFTQADRLLDFNTALFQDGMLIHIDAQLVDPLHFIFLYQGSAQQMAPTRNFVILESKASACLLESYVSLPQNEIFAQHTCQILLREQAQLTHYKLLQVNEQATHLDHLYVKQAADSVLKAHSFSLKSGLNRSDTSVYLTQPGASCSLNGFYIVNTTGHQDHHTEIEHLSSHTTSQQNYKGVAADQAKAVFNGKIHVHPQAQKTSSKQLNKNLLLSPKAEVDTKPELSIFADDVQCTHGATIGQLDEEALFYLESRGLNQREAFRILVQAFAEELIDEITFPTLKDWLKNRFAEKLDEIQL